jgi:hypothetical protein
MTNYYTNELRSDGFGSNYQTLLFTILFVELCCNGEFVYTKPDLKTIYADEADEYEDIMNLSKAFKNITDLSNTDVVQTVPIWQAYSMEQHLDSCLASHTMKKIRGLFKQNKFTSVFDDKYNHVAIHIRRPSMHPNIDIWANGEGWDKGAQSLHDLMNITPRFTSDDYFNSVINHIRNTYTSKPNLFHIISEGKIEDFNNIKGGDIIFHLNDSVKDSYVYMVMSNMFVMSHSSFSYVAGLLNENVVFYKRGFSHTKPNHWLSI